LASSISCGAQADFFAFERLRVVALQVHVEEQQQMGEVCDF
jgi:hypothetical protein